LQEREEPSTRGQILTAQQRPAEMEKHTRRRLSLAYVFRLLHRHGWRRLGPRPLHPQVQPAVEERFKKTPLRSSEKK